MTLRAILREALAQRLARGESRAFAMAEMRGLPMDEASRMARAREMGFDVEAPLYHGTRTSFPSFGELPSKGTASYFGVPVSVERHGIFLSGDQEFASSFAGANTGRGGSPNVMPVFVRPGRQLDLASTPPNQVGAWVKPEDAAALKAQGLHPDWVDHHLTDPRSAWENFDEADGAVLTEAMRGAGYDSARILELDDAGREVVSVVVLNPRNIRSRSAAFDPHNTNRANLLGGFAVGAPIGALTLREALRERAQA